MSLNFVLGLVQWTALSAFYWSTLVYASSELSQSPYLVVEPLTFAPHVVKREQETLNLTCSIIYNSTDIEKKYIVSWLLPIGSLNSQNRVVIKTRFDSANLVIENLDLRDNGPYTCQADQINGNGSLTEIVNVNVKPRKHNCGETQFSCRLSKLTTCISRRYRCDGHPDCENGEDEDSEICGKSACANKLQCVTYVDTGQSVQAIVRCIPKAWCCNTRFEPNCTGTIPLSCCPPKSFADDRAPYYSTHQPHMSEVTFLQTTIYTVIGCAMVFMIVVTVLVIAICRVHMKRSLLTAHCPPHTSHSSHPHHQPSHNPSNSLYDLDFYLNRNCLLDNLTTPGFLVTYNINNGVQIVGHAIDPPPYSEVVCLPPREGPPPPYSLQEPQETEALLQQPQASTPSVLSHTPPVSDARNNELSSTLDGAENHRNS